jgi:MAF protein
MAQQVILASASPRRRDLLARLGIPFEVIPADVDESVIADTRWFESVARDLATRKARTVAESHPAAVVLAADTIVVSGRRLVGKPTSPEDARNMLRRLRNREHLVITGVAVAGNGSLDVEHVRTLVKMRSYSTFEIDASINRKDPFDKAGGYAIQDNLLAPVDSWDGCYCNVVGLPLATTIRMLRNAGVELGDVDLLPQCTVCPLFNGPTPSPS